MIGHLHTFCLLANKITPGNVAMVTNNVWKREYIHMKVHI